VVCGRHSFRVVFPDYNGFGGVYYLLENEALFNYG